MFLFDNLFPAVSQVDALGRWGAFEASAIERVPGLAVGLAVGIGEDADASGDGVFVLVGEQVELSAVEGVAGADVEALLGVEERRAALVVLVVEAVAGDGLELLGVGGAIEVEAPVVVLHGAVDVEVHVDAPHVDFADEFL